MKSRYKQWRYLRRNERIRRDDRPLTAWGISEKTSLYVGQTVTESGHLFGVVREIKS